MHAHKGHVQQCYYSSALQKHAELQLQQQQCTMDSASMHTSPDRRLTVCIAIVYIRQYSFSSKNSHQTRHIHWIHQRGVTAKSGVSSTELWVLADAAAAAAVAVAVATAVAVVVATAGVVATADVVAVGACCKGSLCAAALRVTTVALAAAVDYVLLVATDQHYCQCQTLAVAESSTASVHTY
eukprot:9616-Heterococcus_DN1.PRE.1